MFSEILQSFRPQDALLEGVDGDIGEKLSSGLLL